MEESNNEFKFENELPIQTKVLSKDAKEKIYTKIFKNVCIAILICLYFIFVNLGLKRLDNEVFEKDLHIFAVILIVSTIVVFEKAYKENSNEIAVYGIEILMVSIVTLFLPYIYFKRGNTLKTVYALFEAYLTVYYLLKCFIIYKTEKRKAVLEMSDIKDLVGDSNGTSYLNEKNSRKFENAVEEESKEDNEKEEIRKHKIESILYLLRKDKNINNKATKAKEKVLEEKTKEKLDDENENAKKKGKGRNKKKRGRKPVNKVLVKAIATETRRRKKD